MQINTLVVGNLQTNCYLVTDEETRETFVIDPGDEADFISTTIIENKLIPVGIILTHGHYDHCLGVLELKLNFQIPVYLHPADLPLYQNIYKSASHWSSLSLVKGRSPASGGERDLKPPRVDKYLTDNQIISFGNSSLQVIHTPGHTPGSCCFLSRTKHQPPRTSHLYTGDTLFVSGIGSTDHKYSSPSALQSSLQKLKSTMYHIPCTIYLYPGHEDYGVNLLDTVLY